MPRRRDVDSSDALRHKYRRPPSHRLLAMRWPLRNQIMLPLLAVAVASLAAVGAINARLADRQTRDRIERQLQDVVGVLAGSNFPLTDSVLRQMRDLSQAEFALVIPNGQVVASSFAHHPDGLPLGDAAARTDHVTLGPPVELLGQSYFHTVAELPALPRAGEARRLHVLFPESEYRRTWREAFVPSIIVGIAAVIAVAAVARLLAARISRATTRLSDEVLRLARGDFAPVELPSTNDELRDLSVAVNRTAGMLADYRDQVRHTERMRTVAMLGAGLAHEIRNAATGCRMALDLHVENCNEAVKDESLDVAKRQLQLMESQLQRLLQVGKTPADAPRRELDVAEAVESLLPLIRPAARHARVELEWRRPEREALVLADDEGLGQLVMNLLLNALEAVQRQHGDNARGMVIELTRADADLAVLTVSDTGPGPTGALANSLFDPFVTSKTEGIGLGLSVVRQVVESYQGTIAWSRRDGVTCFRVELPLATKGLLCV